MIVHTYYYQCTKSSFVFYSKDEKKNNFCNHVERKELVSSQV